MAKWNLPEGKLYTQAELDAAVAAALREAAETCAGIRQRIANGPMPEGARFDYEQSILAMIPDAGAALDRALAAERERDAKVAETHPMRFAGQTEDDVRAALAAAIRAQKENPDG